MAAAVAAAAAADEEAPDDDVGIPLPMGPALLLDTAAVDTATAEDVGAVCSNGEGVMLARAGGCPIGVIDRPEPDPIGAGGVGACGCTVSATDTGGAKEVLLGAWIGAGRGGVAAAAETIVVEPGDDCVDGVLLAVGVADDEEAVTATLPNGAGSPLAGDCRICTGARTVIGALADVTALLTLEVATGDGCCCCCCCCG